MIEYKLSDSEKRDFLHSRGVQRVGVHAFTKKILHWPYCARCGLMCLKNDISRRAIRDKCKWEDDV